MEQVDQDALALVVSSIFRFVDPAGAVAARAEDSRRLGGSRVLDRIWDRLDIGAAIRRSARSRRLDGDAVERFIFTLVAVSPGGWSPRPSSSRPGCPSMAAARSLATRSATAKPRSSGPSSSAHCAERPSSTATAQGQGRRLVGVRGHTVVSWALVAAPILAIAALAWTRRWMSDDAFINVRVVQNIFAGHGPVFNVGERVEVGTSTAWLAALSLGHAVVPFVAISQVAVVLGLVSTVAGLALGSGGAYYLWRHVGRGGFVLPLGTIVVAALPPFWDFATSGLETGLAFLWLGACFFALAWRLGRASQAPARPAAWRPLWVAVLVGLGPLVRPDLVLVAALLGLALLVQSRPTWRSYLGGATAALALPVLYEVFRTGYYAALVPNTALAKSAGAALWSKGLTYLDDYAGLYLLAIPLLGVAVFTWMPAVLAQGRCRQWPESALLLAPVLGGLLHALYVVRVGGDFMHGRFLLPATFAVLMPTFVVTVPRGIVSRLAALAPVVGVAVWAVLVPTQVLLPYQGTIGPHGIADERGFYLGYSGAAHPTVIGDYSRPNAPHDWFLRGREARALANRGAHLLVDTAQTYPAADRYGVVGRMGNIGIYGVEAGPKIFVADYLSLANPIGSRLDEKLGPDSRIGHSQLVPLAWDLARYAAPSAADSPAVQNARTALQCGAVARLDEDLTAPMTPGRFFHSILDAKKMTVLRIPMDPAAARARFCNSRPHR